MKIQDLILYRNINDKDKELLRDMVFCMEHYMDKAAEKRKISSLLHKSMNRMIDQALIYGFKGNLWHDFLTHILVTNENSYSLLCECQGRIGGTIEQVMEHDLAIFRELFDFDFSALMNAMSMPELSFILNYRHDTRDNDKISQIYSDEIVERIEDLSQDLYAGKDIHQMLERVTSFFGKYGVGEFGLHKSFRIKESENGASLVPIYHSSYVTLSDLVGYEIQKKKLVDNTEAFVSKRPANNVLLYGDAGTGKSTSIKAITNDFYDRGLRVIEIYKHQFHLLNDIIGQVRNRAYRFIIYMDDLSFEQFETEYKYLKAVIEGGLEERPDNVLIYATSNRRHLIREEAMDKDDFRHEDMHAGDTVQEKLSLAYRFGVSIFYGGPTKKEFQNIVETLAKRNDINMPVEDLFLEANKWELSHGGLNGRTAKQFIDYLLGKETNED